jgi:hypothetical protein
VLNKTVNLLRFERPHSQGTPPEAPLQKLLDEEPIDGSCRLSQPGYLLKMTVVLAAQPLDPRGVLCSLNYAELADGLSPLGTSIATLDLQHGEHGEHKLSILRHASSYLSFLPK